MDFAVNVIKTTPFFQWNLLKDTDDNRFSDCAISAVADYLVTEYNDFGILKQVDFPMVHTKLTRLVPTGRTTGTASMSLWN